MRRTSLAPISRGTRLPSAGYISSRKYHFSPVLPHGMVLPSGATMLFEESPQTQTLPPSPLVDSEMSRSLSSPGIAVGWIWINSPLAYHIPCLKRRPLAAPVQVVEFVDFLKISPGPPVP